MAEDLGCPFCGSDYASRSRRRWWEKLWHLVSGKLPYRCDICGRRFWT